MGDLSTYSLVDLFPFSGDVYFRLFVLHNEQWWPAHVVAYGLLVFILFQIRRGESSSGTWGGSRLAGPLLGTAWLFVGLSFHIEHYADINWAALYFGLGFVVEGLVLLTAGLGGALRFSADGTSLKRTGTAVLLFALIVFPLLDPLTGQRLAGARVFGVMPDPTVIATFGILLLAERARWWLWIVPVLWCVVSGATALAMNHTIGLVTPIAALVAIVLGVMKRRNERDVR